MKEYQFEMTKETPLGAVTPVAAAKYIQLAYKPEDYYAQFPCFVGAKDLGRFLSLAECYQKTLGIAGHMAEVGVYRGAVSMFLAKLSLLYEPHTLTQMHGFDWFREPTPEELKQYRKAKVTMNPTSALANLLACKDFSAMCFYTALML